MDAKVEETLNAALRNWKTMSKPDDEDAEETANEFEASFYTFIDAVREWTYRLDEQPQSLEEFLELGMIQEILERLPAPLHLNFETEAELILDYQNRVDEDKYD
ncbi:hypothetical protein [Paenibacillus sp. SI8]|uniref:hypothetical protein n=1 Tax=unclassified Paenibacillus TaxID=185978 RepID=UPI0034676498